MTDFLNEEGRCFRFGNTFTRFENVQFFTLLRFRLEIEYHERSQYGDESYNGEYLCTEQVRKIETWR